MALLGALVLRPAVLVGRPAPEACLPSEGPYGETERFCVEPPTFILQGDIAEGPHASSTSNNEVQSCPRCRCIFPRTVRIRLYHFRGVHVATQGRSPQSDDAKDTAVEDGIAVPIFYDSIRAEPLGSNRGGVREIMWTRCGAVERLEPDAGSSGISGWCTRSILGARQACVAPT